MGINNRVIKLEKRIDKFSGESFPEGTSEESKELFRLLKPYGGYEGYLRHLLGMPSVPTKLKTTTTKQIEKAQL